MKRICDRLPEWAVVILDRILCRFDVHGLSCRGRADHDPRTGRWWA